MDQHEQSRQGDGVHETDQTWTSPGATENAAAPAEPTEPGTSAAPPAEPTQPGGIVNSGSDPVPADDLAPDADEPGDDLPADLAGHVHEGDIVPDNVDHREVEPDDIGQDPDQA